MKTKTPKPPLNLDDELTVLFEDAVEARDAAQAVITRISDIKRRLMEEKVRRMEEDNPQLKAAFTGK